MKLRNRIIISLIITILFTTAAVLIWANESGKITIWGDAPDDAKPEISLGLPVTLTGHIKKSGDYYIIYNDQNYPYDVYITNSMDLKYLLDQELNNQITAYGSLGGETNNQLFLLWLNGSTIYEEKEGRGFYEAYLDNNATEVLNSFSTDQKNCIFNIVSEDVFVSMLQGYQVSIPQNQIDLINKCLE